MVYNISANGEKKVNRKILPLGNKLKCYFFKNYSSLFNYEYVSEGRNFNIKVGTINDISILKSIKNGESDCLSKLLSYAKRDNGILKTSFNYEGSKKYNSIYSLYNNWVDGGYYYVYMEYDDENGKYIKLEDVSLYQCLNSQGTNNELLWDLVDYLSDDFKWNLGDDGNSSTKVPDKKDDTTATKPIPQTGETFIIVGSILMVVVVATIAVIKYRRYRDI